MNVITRNLCIATIITSLKHSSCQFGFPFHQPPNNQQPHNPQIQNFGFPPPQTFGSQNNFAFPNYQPGFHQNPPNFNRPQYNFDQQISGPQNNIPTQHTFNQEPTVAQSPLNGPQNNTNRISRKSRFARRQIQK